MKSKISLACLFLASAAGAQTSGFYTGVGAVYSSFHSDLKISASVPPDFGDYTFDIKKGSMNLKFFAGYQKYMGNHFIAAEVFATPFQDTLKKTTVGSYESRGAGALMFNDVQIKTWRRFSAGLNLKYGRHFDDRTAAFVTLGLVGSQFKVRHSDDTPQSINYQKYQMGYAPGAGIKYYIKDRMPITFQYDYEVYKKFSTKNMSLLPGSNITYKPENKYHNFMISISCEL
ncbi:MAG: outer membrane protein [Alphaproteobacteria bacterium]